MSQAEELLNNLSVHEHDMADSDAYFVINPKSRQIDHFSRTQNVIMQGDHKSELYTFQLPRYVEGHDMLLCNRVRVHYNNIEAETGKENADVYEMTDLHVNPGDPETVISSWEIHKQATQLVGILSFLVQYECVDSNGESTYEWHTDFYDDVIVKKTKHNGEAAVVNYSDILEQWYTRIFGTGESVIADITEAAEQAQEDLVATRTAQVEAIRLKGEETLATIPEDYTSTYNMAEEALRRKASAIVLEADGETISIDDASDSYLLGLKLYGKTKQNTTTGKNLCPGYKRGAYNNSTGEYSTEFTGYYCSEMVPVTSGVGYVISNGLGRNPSMIHAYDPEGNWLGSTTLNNLPSNVAYIGVNYLTPEDLGWIQVEEGTEVTEYEAYSGGVPGPNPAYPQELVSVENPTVKLSGKNLLEFNFPTATNAGISYTLNNDGSLTINGTATELSYYTFCFGNEIPAYGTDVTISLGNNNGKVTLTVGYFKENGETVNDLAHVVNGEVTFSYPQEAKTTRTFIVVSAGAVCDNLTVYPMMRLANTTSDFERTEVVQSMTIANTLRSVPVTYWDNNDNTGKLEMIRDEIDLERGVFIQRIGVAVMDEYTYTEYSLSGKTGRGQLIVSPYPAKDRLFYGTVCSMALRNDVALSAVDGEYYENPANIVFVGDANETEESIRAKYANFVLLYVLAAPIETPLTDVEIAEYKKLTTNYHNTVVVNDQNAHMSIAYAADTKLYIDKRINEALKAAGYLS